MRSASIRCRVLPFWPTETINNAIFVLNSLREWKVLVQRNLADTTRNIWLKKLMSFYGSGKKEAKNQADMHSRFCRIGTEKTHFPLPKERKLL